MESLKYLNLGCGDTFHNDWINIDFRSRSKNVLEHNLLQGIPKDNSTAKVIYHSHVLEHFSKSDAILFIKDCHRVLEPNGIIRIVVPDLEQIVMNYINYLHQSIDEIPDALEKYNWTLLELFDQIARQSSGGDMIEYIKDESRNNDLFLLERNGSEVENLMRMIRYPNNSESEFRFLNKLKSINLKKRIKIILFKLIFGKNDFKAYQLGKFRLGGEVHQWMYDRLSLKCMLQDAGFKDVEVKTAFDSKIVNWSNFNLDGIDGVIRKPDSIYVEAIKR